MTDDKQIGRGFGGWDACFLTSEERCLRRPSEWKGSAITAKREALLPNRQSRFMFYDVADWN
jgi:hypothetical protein